MGRRSIVVLMGTLVVFEEKTLCSYFDGKTACCVAWEDSVSLFDGKTF